MIFCTWASDDFNSDVYVRKDADAFFIHVAHARYATEAPRSIDASTVPRKPGVQREAALEAYCRRALELMEWIIATPTIPLGGDHAGEQFVELDHDAAIARLWYLESRGYRVPISVMREIGYRRDLELEVARNALEGARYAHLSRRAA